MRYRALHNRMNGRFTTGRPESTCSYDDAKPQIGSNHWSSTENNRNNARNVNFNNGNANNNNKYNGNVLRPVTAFLPTAPASFIASVWEAYHDCVKGKMGSTQAIEYMSIAEYDIPYLAQELWDGTYKPGTSTCFLVKYPKWREVFAAGFRDRIIHHWICMRLEPLFEHRFEEQGNISFNCRKGFGTDKAVAHLADEMDKVSEHYHKQAWVFHGDLVGFFMSIDKDLLWYLLERFIKRWRKRYEREGWSRLTPELMDRLDIVDMPEMYWDTLLQVTKVVVKHHPEEDCIFNSPTQWWGQHLTMNKSLFTSEDGEPIGNLTTQQFANFLMSFFVIYVLFLFRRHNFGMAQFVDDFCEVCDDLDFLIKSLPLQERFLKDKLHLTMHQNKRYLQPVSHGIMFVGSYIKPGRTYLSNRTLGKFFERCNNFRKMFDSCDVGEYELRHVEQVINSYLGFCKDKRTYSYRIKCITLMGENFWKYFIVRGHYESVRLKQQYRLFAA